LDSACRKTKTKPSFSSLLAKVESGEEIIIARSGKPIARLCALASNKKQPKRKPGFAKGLLPESVVEKLFDPALDQEIEALFYRDSHDESSIRQPHLRVVGRW
jgi:prevent-host-death family protein